MDLGLAGRCVVVTGGSRGIGLATVRRLVAEGARVVAAARTTNPELVETGAILCEVDLRTAGGVEQLVQHAIGEMGDIDVLVNNVGGGARADGLTFLESSDEEWREFLELNLMAPLRVTRAALPSLMRTGGVVVTVSSVGALTPRSSTFGIPIAYASAKAALNAAMKALAAELGEQGVRVTTVSPGATRTPLWEGHGGASIAERLGVPLSDLLAAIPNAAGMVTKRWITPEEIASLIAFAASPLAASVVGANFVVDGGETRSL